MNDEYSQQRQNDIDEELTRANKRGEVIYIKDMSKEEKLEFADRALHDNNVLELYKHDEVIAYQIIPEDYE